MFFVNYISNPSNMSFVASYCVGLAILPLSLVVSEIFTRIGQACNLTSISYSQKIIDNWQTGDHPLAVDSDSFVRRQFKIFISNQMAPLIEEIVFKKIFQDFILTHIPELVGLSVNSLPVVAGRVVFVSMVFGLCHVKEAELMIKAHISQEVERENISRQAKQVKIKKLMLTKNEEIIDNRNFQIIHTIGRSILWSVLYECSNRNFALIWGARVGINYFWDFVRYKH